MSADKRREVLAPEEHAPPNADTGELAGADECVGGINFPGPGRVETSHVGDRHHQGRRGMGYWHATGTDQTRRDLSTPTPSTASQKF